MTMVSASPAEAGRRTAGALHVDHVSKSFRLGGAKLAVLDNVSLNVDRGEFVSIVGPSGCGKSTLFNILSGLDTADAGRIWIDGDESDLRLGKTGYMPQRDALLPWKSVLDNAALGARLGGLSRREARREAVALFPRFGLSGFEHSYPRALSGGMRQRAALLRTVLSHRQTLLLDEPFGALDSLTRTAMQSWLLDLRSTLDRTIMLITHDVDEAVYLSDRVYVMSSRPGRMIDTVRVDLHERRDHDAAVTSSDFVATKRRLLRALRSSVEEVLS